MNGLMKRSNFFDDFFTKDLFDFNSNNFSQPNVTLPSVNVQDLEERYEIHVAAPGMEKENFSVSLDKNRLTISGTAKDEQGEQQHHYTRREFNYSSFTRSFVLPDTVEQDGIEAEYKNGILTIAVPKKAPASQPMKTIEIK